MNRVRETGGAWRAAALAAWVAIVATPGCDRPTEAETPVAAPGVDASRTASGAQPLLVDATRATGLDFVHFNGMTGRRYIVEMMGPGGALFDYDGDGDLDLWLRQGRVLERGKTVEQALFPPESGEVPTDRLFRNDLVVAADGTRTLRWTDVTAATGVSVSDYGLGIATGDYDDDGDVDLYLTNLGPNRFLKNEGGGRFVDVTERTGTDDPRWSTPAVFADWNGDGLLDLWVGNYVDFHVDNHRVCYRPNSAEDYCGPLSFNPEPDRMFRNRGDGTFEDVTAAVGLAAHYGNSLGVLVQDYDADGRLDLFVANDAQDNHLWLQGGDGRFTEDGLLRGVAVNGRGEREGSMGVGTGDYDADGHPDVFVTHMATETNTLYASDGEGLFSDVTRAAGLATPSQPMTGFGTGWFDVDNDGWEDLYVANGEVKVISALEREGDPFPLHQPDQLFRNLGDGTFRDVSNEAGVALRRSAVGRGAIFGDVDNDGDTDVVVVNNNGPTWLLLNATGQDRHWLGLEPKTASGRWVQGARIELRRAGDPPRVRWSGTDGSYCSANDPRVRVGLGADPRPPESIVVHWPGGRAERFEAKAVDRYVALIEGTGTPVR